MKKEEEERRHKKRAIERKVDLVFCQPKLAQFDIFAELNLKKLH